MGFIYKITNKVNGKVYIGQTVKNIEHRFHQHINNALRDQNSYDCALRRAIRKYGVENFSIEEVEECDKPALDEREIYWIQFYDSFHNGYNLTLGGNSPGHTLGVPLSEAHRQALREGHKHRDKSTYRPGKATPESIAKFKRTYWSKPEEVRKEQARRATAHRKPSHIWLGKHLPQETRNKISETLKEKHLCPPHARKVYCQETDTTYRSLTEAQDVLGVDRHIIRRYIDGKRKDEKFHFSFVKTEA